MARYERNPINRIANLFRFWITRCTLTQPVKDSRLNGKQLLNRQIPLSAATRMTVAVNPKSGKKFRHCLRWHDRIAVNNALGNGRQMKIPIKRHQWIDKLLAVTRAGNTIKIAKFTAHCGCDRIGSHSLSFEYGKVNVVFLQVRDDFGADFRCFVSVLVLF